MNLPIRSFLALLVLAVALAACGSTIGAPTPTPAAESPSETPTPSQPAAPSEAPSEQPTEEPTEEPSQAPTQEREVDGVITVYPGIASGPGGSIADALANGPSGDLPDLVNGVLFRDTDGRIFLATEVADANAPTFDGPMLEVIGFPSDGESWDMANADLIGLEEANGIIFKRDSQVLGTIELP